MFVGGDQRGFQVECRGGENAVGGVGVHFPGEAGAEDGDRRGEWVEADAGESESFVDPELDVFVEVEALFGDEEGDFPGGDGRDDDGVFVGRMLDLREDGFADALGVSQEPDEHVGVEHERGHLLASHSTSMGEMMSPSQRTEPFSAPRSGMRCS